MKKGLLIGILGSVIALSACNQSDSVKEKESEPSQEVVEGQKEVKENEVSSEVKQSEDEEKTSDEKPVKELNLNLDELYPQPELKAYAEKFIGKKAPNFTLQNVDGESISLSDFKGKNVIIEMASTTCHVCQSTQPLLNEYKKTLKDVTILQVFAMENKDAVESFLKNTDTTERTNVLIGETPNNVANDYEIDYVPTFLFVDANGFVSLIHIGGIDKETLDLYKELSFE